MITRPNQFTIFKAIVLVLRAATLSLPSGSCRLQANTKEEETMNNPIDHEQVLEEVSQTHVHEFEASTKLAEEGEDRHNHRFAGVTSQLIPDPEGHRHAIFTNTDFFENHHHEVGVITGLPIPVGNNKHIHFVTGNTTMDDGHFHEFQFTTLILDPLN